MCQKSKRSSCITRTSRKRVSRILWRSKYKKEHGKFPKSVLWAKSQDYIAPRKAPKKTQRKEAKASETNHKKRKRDRMGV